MHTYIECHTHKQLELKYFNTELKPAEAHILFKCVGSKFHTLPQQIQAISSLIKLWKDEESDYPGLILYISQVFST
jgi:hypothetical protein